MRSRLHPAILGSVLLVLVVCPASSQESSPVREKTNWDFSVWVAAATGEEITNSFSESQIWSAGVFAGRVLTAEHCKGWRRGEFEYAIDVVPVFSTSGNQHVHGFGFDPVILRWNSSLRKSGISPYIELAGGGLITNSNLPPGDTSSFNFTPKGGGGIYVRTRQRQALDIGVRWSHISNANLGVDNPEFNGIQVSFAYHWFR